MLRRPWQKPGHCFPSINDFVKCPWARYGTRPKASQKDRREKELRRLIKQRKVVTNIRYASKAIKGGNQIVNYLEEPYPTHIPLGEKKDVEVPLPQQYSPVFTESHWYEWWEKMGFFKPRTSSVAQEVFSMALPPPNVTGKLHLGHALTCAVEDVLVRWKTMLGHEVLWVPGTDHAGIATQVVVERELEREHGETRLTLGPEKMKEAIWKWKENKGENINQQLRKLGSSLDWDRYVFTLDKNYAHAVNEAFVRLFDDGLIYRDKCCVNWCCYLQSTVSDLEVETRMLDKAVVIPVPGYENPVQFGAMHEFAYKLCQPVGDVTEIVVGTTRPETIPGDEAVAVNPNDTRYSSLIGKRVFHPMIQHKTIPIIADEAVEMDLGTGALKVTPAHDFTDFEIGKRHGLPITTVITADGRLNYERPNVPEHLTKSYDHINDTQRFKARQQIITHLIHKSMYRGSRPQNSTLRLCSRSGDVIEPMVKEQWFIRTDEMAEEVLKAYDSGALKLIHQSMYDKQWKEWLNRTTPWCISRQIWWGHRIPAYKCTNKTNEKSFWVAAHSQSEALDKAKTKYPDMNKNKFEIQQDSDVLDTWFSSALHPFASLGWPSKTEDLKTYYPLSLMETGSDLIYFWVARMAMLGIKLTGQVPFREVLFHPMVRDKFNRKMSKSVGNVVDPIHVISGVEVEHRVEDLKDFDLEQEDALKAVQNMKNDMGGKIPLCGSDALRMSLLHHSLESQGVQFDVTEAINARRFCNKVQNAFQFLMQYVSDDPKFVEKIQEIRTSRSEQSLMNSWILSYLLTTAEKCNRALSNYKFNEALQSVKKFWIDMSTIYLRYCFVYLTGETENKNNSRVDSELMENCSKMAIIACLIDVTEAALRLLSPFAPFLTEELWQRIPSNVIAATPKPESIFLSSFPTVENIGAERSPSAERAVELMWNTVENIRQEKVMFFLPRNIGVIIVSKSDQSFKDLSLMSTFISVFFPCNKFEVHPFSEFEKLKETCFGSVHPEDDVIILYRLQASDFKSYLIEKGIEKQLQIRRENWIKQVEKLEGKARRSPNNETFKKTTNEILKECEKYLKFQRYEESIKALKLKLS